MVVKRSYSKMILREFRHSFSRFLAIFAIIALGVGFLAGLLATTPDMRYSMDQYYRQTNLMDLRIVSTMGLTKQDVEEIRSTEGVEDGMPSYTSDALVTLPSEDTAVARIHSLPACREAGEPLTSETSGYLNQLTLAEGRLPENPGECVIKPEHLSSENIPIGSTIKLSEENQNLEETFQTTEYIVVGYVYSSYYASIEKETSTVGNGTVGMVMFIPEQDFALDVYTDMFVTLSDAKALDSLSDPSAYDAAVDPVVSTLEDLGQQRAPLRDKEIREEAQEKIDDAQKEFEEQKADAQKQLDDARAELDNGWQELDSAKQELSDGKLALEEARRQLEEAPGQISSGEAEIQSSEETLAQGQAEYDAGWQEYQSRKQEAEAAFAQQEQDLGQKEDEYNVNKAALDLEKGKMDQAKAEIDAAKLYIEQLRQQGLIQQAQQLEEQLKPKEEAYAAGFQQYQEAKAQLDGYKLLLDQGRQTLEAAKQEAQQKFEETEGQLVGAKKELDDGWLQLDSAKAELAQAKLELENGRRELEENQKTLDDAQLQIDDSEKQLEEGEAEYLKSKTEADQKLSDAQKEIDDAQKELDQLEPSEWMVLGRDTNVGYVSFDSNAEKVEAIAKVFPIFFFLVAALVVLTTATRMVDEERTQIGVMKALGYGKGKIAAQYLIYVAVATITGSLFGLLVGFYVFPTVIWNAYTIMYDLPALVIQFNWKYALLSSGAAILTTLLTTFWACYSSLKEAPSRLILPKAPKSGKRILLEKITPLWSRLSFIHKVTARNLFRYKKRFLMTVVGIAGCTALLLTGFGLQDSISDIVNLQFGEVLQYNLTITAKDSEKMKEDPAVQELLDDTGTVDRYLRIAQEGGDASANGQSLDVYLFVPEEPDRLSQFVTLQDRKSKVPAELEEDAVLLTEKAAERLGVAVGDTITVQRNDDHRQAEFTVGGVVENYVQNYIYLSPALYEEGYHTQPEMNQTIAVVPDGSQENRDRITSAFLESDQVQAVSFTDDIKASFQNTIKSIDFIVIVLIVSAGLLAFVVLYNLTNINITERQKEIATIKVLGFYDKEVSAYIYRETGILTLIGTAIGLIFGIFLHAFVVKTAEVDMVMFGREIKWLSYVFSALLTIFFSIIVNLVMYRKLKKISMVESMKSTE